MKKLICIIGVFIVASSSLAQSLSENSVNMKLSEQGDFLFQYPLHIPQRLNANFGEMRSNHFHMGLDMFTEKRENLNVYAAGDGFVSRVKIESGGFGNAIYIEHRNGYTTLYAHMNKFLPALEQYIKEQQYKVESWAIDLTIPPMLFPIRKGEFLGLSGNTGASQGPHLHFEVRDTKTEKCINPLLFALNMADHISPDIYKLAFYNREKSIYEQQPILVPVIKKMGAFTANVPVLPFSKVAVSIQSTDKMDGVQNLYGIYSAKLLQDGKVVGGFTLKEVGYDETRHQNAHIDFSHKMKTGTYLQTLFPLPGDMLPIYINSKPGSALVLNQGDKKDYSLEVSDVKGNKSVISFQLRYEKKFQNAIDSLFRGPLMIPNQVNIFDSQDVEIYFPEGCLYDSIHFKLHSTSTNLPLSFSKSYMIHDVTVPLHQNMTVRMKSDKVIPYHLRDRMLIRKLTKSNVIVKKASWEMGKYSAAFREFGVFELIADDQPPVIHTPLDGKIFSSTGKIVISVSDDHVLIKNFRATLDGKWLRFIQKGNFFIYNVDEKCLPGEHELKLFVEDESGNQTEKIFHFKQ